MTRPPSAVVEKRFQVERERQASFFALLQMINIQCAVAFPLTLGLSTLEQRLTMNCLDEISGRYADFSFLLTFSICYVLRNRAATNIFRRYRLPVYLSLVGYDCGLRSGSPCPATTFWNTVPHLDSNLGEMARLVLKPDVFYEVPSSMPLMSPSASASSDGRQRRMSYTTWMGSSVVFVAKSFFLPRLLAEIFKGSCFRRRLDEQTEQTAIVVNNRFLRWRIFDLRHTTTDEMVNDRVEIPLLPKLEVSRSLRWAYRCRRVVLDNSSLPARVWYSTHFFLMRQLGLDQAT